MSSCMGPLNIGTIFYGHLFPKGNKPPYKNQETIETFIYRMVSIGIMNTQINVRIPQKLLSSVRSYSDEHGYGSVQDFIKETIREKLFDEPEISKEELALVKKLAELTGKKKLYGTERELFSKLRRR